jgi:hypothetical protein
LSKSILKNQIFAVLPVNDPNNINEEIVKTALDVLVKISLKLFSLFTTDEEDDECQKRFKDADGYNLLLFLLKSYSNIYLKEQIAIILGRFHDKITIPSKEKIIIDILLNGFKNNTSTQSSLKSSTEHITNIINALISISRSDENSMILYNDGIIPLSIPYI